MSTSLDMSLDDIITRNKLSDGGPGACFTARGRGRGRNSGSGSSHCPFRRFARYQHVRPQPYPMRPRMISPEPLMLRSEGPNAETGTKLYVSNLDYGVSDGDIKLLFSDVGELKRHSIHYDKSGRSKGTAEVVFARQADALASIERYNNVQLDGKPMRIELVGVDLLTPPVPMTSTSNSRRHLQSKEAFRMIYDKFHTNGSSKMNQCEEELKQYQEKLKSKQVKNSDAPSLFGEQMSYQGSFSVRGRGYGSVHGRGFSKGQSHRRCYGEKVTAEELDADLERYHFEAMKIS